MKKKKIDRAINKFYKHERESKNVQIDLLASIHSYRMETKIDVIA